MKPIETRYNGRRFRSRLEARWAVLMDAIGVRYDYEPEGFRFDVAGEMVLYLPDFWLPDFDAWVEIKGTKPTPAERRKCALLAAGQSCRVYLLAGQLPEPECTLFYGWPDGFTEEHESFPWNGRELFGSPTLDDAIGIALAAQFEHRHGPNSFTTAADVIAAASDGVLGSVRRALEIKTKAKPRPEGDLPA